MRQGVTLEVKKARKNVRGRQYYEKKESEKRKTRLLKKSGIRGKVSDYDRMNYDPSRNLDRGLLEELSTCRWITEDNPAHGIVTGAPGTGKTWLIEMLGKCACQKGISVYCTRMSDLIDMLDIARKEHRVIATRKKINRCQLLLPDDFAMTPLSDQQADDFLSLIDGRQGGGFKRRRKNRHKGVF